MSETPVNQNSGIDKGCERNHSRDNRKDDKKIRKLEQPIFNRDDPFGWTFKADRYFAINQYKEKEMVEAAAMCMEGRALNWYQWLESPRPVQSWKDFKVALIDRFRPSFQGTAYEALVALRQIASVTKYREEFEAHTAPLKELREEMLMGIFINGLKEEIRAELPLIQAKDVGEVMEQAYQILLAWEDEDPEKGETVPDDDEEPNTEGNPLALSMNSIVGITSNKTLKIKGEIEGVGVIMLVDSRASHNFISHDLVRKLGMQIETGKRFRVMVGNGVTVRGEGVCRAVPLEVQGVRIT
ncbi:uncharacterized protein LOC116129775 [Pistacia vera]|uniref:uncharacterized protein LOC116129775 n=1 Tax=Pistacia vera TaxID=55513 RepID=UPI001262CB1A|nr:uncharacterized protein LOC116129775 [Pistacia vera]